MEDNRLNETNMPEASDVSEEPSVKTKSKKPKKLRNMLLFKKGGYSVAITAFVLVAIILVNWLVGALSARFNLKFDITSDRRNTLNPENVEYVKGIDTEVSIVFCADEKDYVAAASSNSMSMSGWAASYYQVSDSKQTDYYNQTINIVKRYTDYNKKISLKFMDTQSAEFMEIYSKYSADNISYGDIVVFANPETKDGKKIERHKIITYKDIYSLADQSGYASMGYGYYTIGGNNIETELTSAIAFVCSTETKKAALLTGHSSNSYYDSYRSLLEENNYEVTLVSDAPITELSSEFDIVALVAPNVDFVGPELDVISEFLYNDGKLQKGLIYFAGADSPVLENLNAFLEEWGISVGDAILFETNKALQYGGDPFSIVSYPSGDGLTEGMSYCITGYNLPVLAVDPVSADTVVTELMSTSNTVVAAPRGSNAGYSGYSDSDKSTFATAIQAENVTYDDDNNEISSYVIAFSSVEFIYSDWAQYPSLSNKNISLSVANRAANVGENGISFISKSITEESFSDSVNSQDIFVITVLFVFVIPILVIAAGIVIFIRRKNA